MKTETVIAGLAVVIAVTVPWMTFRLALRQDQVRWLRERRADLYVDLLTEAHAEKQYFDVEIADEETRKDMLRHFVDLRLPPLERARLGARGTIFGSRAVNQVFNRLEGEALRATLVAPRHEGDRLTARVRVEGALEELQAAIRHELGADVIPVGDGRNGSSEDPARRVTGHGS